MKRKWFTEEQIIGGLCEQEAGGKTGNLARKHMASKAMLYIWKAKFGWMDVSEARRLKAQEDENGKLKRLLADAMDLLSSDGEGRRQAWVCRPSECALADD